MSALTYLFWIVLLCAIVFLRWRDRYVVIREFRIVEPSDFGKGKTVETRHLHCFDDFAAAKVFFDLHNTYAAVPYYENQQNINYLYAVPAFTAALAETKMTKQIHHRATLLAETPQSVLVALKRHWDEERKARSALAKVEE